MGSKNALDRIDVFQGTFTASLDLAPWFSFFASHLAGKHQQDILKI